ncbi:MAG TPA: hypothetical protein DEP84_03660 [Chloroflexi bacterium]|nr:hypothetical protein [Chloroflexota bacterium]
MLQQPTRVDLALSADVRLPLSLLTRYLFFLTRRPISQSNAHYLQQRLDGLKSLAEPLDTVDSPALKEAIALLRAMNPRTFYQLAERLQLVLFPLASAMAEIPADVVVSDSPLPRQFWSGFRRILLLFGPAIGIGDEVIFFPLPRWIKAANSHADITVLSAYQGLWEQVGDVDQIFHYTEYVTLLRALRGQAPFEGFDIVILADFERPDLSPAVCCEPNIPYYVELSSGTQSSFLVDNRRRWLHRARRALPYFANYYFGLDNLARWLGLSPTTAGRFSTVMHRTGEPPEHEVRVYVNPFTSKYDPSEAYWSRLLSSLFSKPPARPVRFVIDPGPNPATARFASGLARSTAARTPPGIDFDIVRPQDDRVPSLQKVFAQMERAHVVICSDSFAAHAAPLFNCTTLVVAGAGLENWRVPHRSSYYFDADAPIAEVIAGMRQVLKGIAVQEGERDHHPSLTGAVEQFEAAVRALQPLLDGELDGNFDTLCETYDTFVKANQAVVDHLLGRSPELGALLRDFPYEKPVFGIDNVRSIPEELRQDVVLHLRDRWEQWQNTNLYKYLMLAEARS